LASETELFDVVVAGGGPAGASAAYTAAKAGLTVALIDKADFPRDKLCGGGLTERCRSLFQTVYGQIWPEAIVSGSAAFNFAMAGAPLSRMEGYSQLGMTMRRAFDAHMVDLARAAGARTLLGDAVGEVDLDARAVTLKSGRRIGYGHLIGADGVSSVVAKTLFGRSFDPARIGFGLEVEVPRADAPDMPDEIEIDFGAAVWGYGWVFPKAASYTIGVGGVHTRNPQMRAALFAYLAQKGLDPARYKVKGQYLPFGDPRPAPGRGRVLLAGDAAGFVDPITGEGIGYAIESGAAAGRAVAEAVAAGTPDVAFERYARATAPIFRAIRQARGWRLLIFPNRMKGLFSLAFGRAGALRRGYLDIMAGTRDYDDLWGLMGAELATVPGRLARRMRRRLG
jgi:geranylgeranyl reductase family protein